MKASQQVSIIQRVLSAPPKVPHYRFNFGKYKGVLLEDVMATKQGIQYLEWLLSEDFIPVHVTVKIEAALETV